MAYTIEPVMIALHRCSECRLGTLIHHSYKLATLPFFISTLQGRESSGKMLIVGAAAVLALVCLSKTNEDVRIMMDTSER